MNTGQQATRVDSPLKQGGGVVVGRQRTLKRGSRARSQEKPLLPGQVRCDTCGTGYTPLSDGRPRAHQADRYTPCAAVPGSTTGSTEMCEHGNLSTQRTECCGIPPGPGQRPRPVPEHLRRFV